MNTKGIKFLAVLAVLAMAFAVFAVVTDSDSDAAPVFGPIDPPVSVDGTEFLAVENNKVAEVTTGTTTTYKLTKNVTLTGTVEITEAKKIVIDLNGHTIAGELTTAFKVTNGSLTVKDSSDDTTGVISVTGEAFRVEGTSNDSSLTLTGITVMSSTDCCIFFKGPDHGTTTTSVTIKCEDTKMTTSSNDYAAIQGNGLKNNETITLKNCDIVSTNSHGLYLPNDGKTTITGGSITGVTGIEIRAGTLEISETKITATGEYSVASNGNGESTYGAAVAVAQHTTSKDITVTINSGEFIGEAALSIANPQNNETANPVNVTVKNGTFKGEIIDSDLRETNAFEVRGGVFSDYSVFKYTTSKSTGANVNAGGKMIPGAAPKTNDDIKASMLSDDGTILYIKNADLTSGTNIFDFSITKLATVTKIEFIDAVDRNVVFLGVAEKGVNAEVLINDGAVAFYGFNNVEGDLNDDDNESTPAPVAFEDLYGAFTFSNGALNVADASGTITLANGQELKLSGSVDGSLNIGVAEGASSAKIIVEAGDDKMLKVVSTTDPNDGLVIDGKIAVDVYGKITGLGKITAGKFEAFDGAFIDILSIVVTKGIANTGSDINFAGISDFSVWSGKDAANGTWSVVQSKLTIDGYNGAYNFYNYEGGDVLVKGDVVISYAPTDGYYIDNYFNGAIKTVQDAGTLTLNVDLSQLEFGKYMRSSAYIRSSNIDTVGVNVNVTGVPDWEEMQLKMLMVIGLEAEKLYSAPVNVNVFGGEDSVMGIGAIIGEMTNCGNVTVNASFMGIAINGPVKDTNIAAEAGFVSVIIGNMGGMQTGDSAEAIEISSNSAITTTGGVMVTGPVNFSQGAILDCADLILMGTITNNGVIKTSGNSLIYPDATLINSAVFENSGKMGVYGTIENDVGAIKGTAGTITNSGDIIYHAWMFSDGDNYNEVWFSEDKVLEKDKAKSKLAWADFEIPSWPELFIDKETFGFNMDGYLAIIDGVIPVKGSADFTYYEAEYSGYMTYYEYLYEVEENYDSMFEGTITILADGYLLSMTDGTATIDIEAKIIGYDDEDMGYTYEYTVSATGSGKIVKVDDNGKIIDTKTLPFMKNEKEAEGDYYPEESYCALDLKAGVVNNTGTFILESLSDVTIAAPVTFNGDLTVYGYDIEIDMQGTFNGNITAPAVKVTGVMTGNITADTATVAAGGELTGDITAEGDVTLAGTVAGNVNMNKGETKIVASGNADVSVTYTESYLAAWSETDSKAITPTEFTVTFDLVTAFGEGAENAVTILMVPGTDAVSATSLGTPGYITYGETPDIGKGKATVTVNSGAFKTDATLTRGYELVIESGATLEVAKGNTLDVKQAALKVSKTATRNYDNDNYGKIEYIISFDIAAGYTIYSDLAYALSNCDENSTLTLGSSGSVDQDIDVKKGVNIIVGEGIELSFKDDVSAVMQDGAKFTIQGTGEIVFAAMVSEDDKVDNKISGTFDYDGNVIILENVVFYTATTFSGLKATTDAPSMINVEDASYIGKATVSAGAATGEFTLNVEESTDKVTKEKVYTIAELVIAEGAAVYYAEIADDDFYVEPAKASEKGYYVLTVITVDGTLYADDLQINGAYNGKGQVILKDDRDISVLATAVLNVKIADAAGNGYEFVEVKDSSFSIESQMDKTANVLVLANGALVNGQITALKDAYLDAFDVGYVLKDATQVAEEEVSDATVVADNTNIVSNSASYGKLKTKALIETDTAKLDYDATYADGDYTVYTHFLCIDQTEVTDITVDGNKLSDNLADKDLVIAGINLTIADKTVLVLSKNLIIGTPRTTLGAGTTVTGDIVIKDDKFVIVYFDADVTGAKFYGEPEGGYIAGTTKLADCPAAVTSAFDIEGSAYAVAYANADDVALTEVASAMKPAIAGYTFTKWVAYNTMEALGTQKVGETDVTATLVAGKVTVNATAYEGVVYYCNGVEFMSTGMDVQVDVGSVFTAKIVDKDKLEGTPLVNGVASYKVADEYNVLEISGVKEKKASSGDDDDDDGLGLTEILLIVLVVLIAVMCVILILRLNRS